MNTNTNSVKRPALAAVGAPLALLLIFAATLVPFFMADSAWARDAYPYVFSAGAAGLLAVRLFTPYQGRDFRLKRLHRIESWIAIIFCAGAFFLFYNDGLQLRDWLRVHSCRSRATDFHLHRHTHARGTPGQRAE